MCPEGNFWQNLFLGERSNDDTTGWCCLCFRSSHTQHVLSSISLLIWSVRAKHLSPPHGDFKKPPIHPRHPRLLLCVRVTRGLQAVFTGVWLRESTTAKGQEENKMYSAVSGRGNQHQEATVPCGLRRNIGKKSCSGTTLLSEWLMCIYWK